MGRQFTKESSCQVKLCGIIPIKNIAVHTLPAVTVIPSGNIVGIKLYTKGVAVVATDSFNAGGREYSPALSSGIKPGDIILAVNNEEVNSADKLSDLIESSTLSLNILRDGKEQTIRIKPFIDPDTGRARLGLWVRDSCAGIGTMTFYRPDTGTYGALGHGLTDGDTGIVLPTSGGELTFASVLSIKKGKSGSPGELCGIFSADSTPLGTLDTNSETGITGTLFKKDFSENDPCALCPRNEIKCGKAYIYSCISGTDVQKYEIEILRVYNGEKGNSKDMLLRITDERLLRQTGGIVQGMSGSPIIQNGRIVGAVTHVFVNDPTRGYGIFIENMLAEAEKIK